MKRLALLGALRLSLYFKEKNMEEVFEKYPGLLYKEATKEDLKKNSLSKVLDRKNEADSRIINILELCRQNEIAIIAFEISAFRYMDERVGEILSLISKEGRGFCTLEIAALCLGYESVYDGMEEIMKAYDSMELILDEEAKTDDLPRAPLKFNFMIVSHLSLNEYADRDMVPYLDSFIFDDELPDAFGFKDRYVAFSENVNSYFDKVMKDKKLEETPVTLVISGEKESGRWTVMQYVCSKLGVNVLSVEAKFLLDNVNPRNVLRRLYLECALTDSFLCIRNIPDDKDTKELIIEARKGYNRFLCRPLILIVDSKVKCIPYLFGNVIPFEIGKCTTKQSEEIWEGLLKKAGLLNGLNCSEIASKMNLTAGQIKRIVDLLKTQFECTGEKPCEKDVFKLCYKVLDDGRYDNIKRVESNYTLSDVQTSENNIVLLKAACAQVTHRQKVYGEWEMAKKYEYGRCVSMILAGPPGTGKTMAVHALSNELGLELYKVDLSQVVDKYIGETEKRLEEIFTRAEKSNMILFFDEADAVMGKRTETKEANDKYANTEIAFILQRMEEYDGIVILATNFLQNIDPAFMRRIKYVINFELPEKETRLALWKGSFSEKVPLSKDIDWDFLAGYFDLSGGNIKNITLNATFLAASDNKPVSMEHIMKALMRENTKDKRIAFIADYGKYGFLCK